MINPSKSSFKPVIQIFLTLLFVITPFYTQPNAGPLGLALPYNIPQWAISAWVISYALLVIAKSKILFLPKSSYLYIIFPLTICVSGLLSEITDPSTWLFRQLYILGGLLFLFSLFQLRLKQRQIDTILSLFVIAMILHSIIGIHQIIWKKEIFLNWFPPASDGAPRGMFEQINVHVTYLATGVITAFYLISRPFFKSTSSITKVLFIISVGLSTYIIIYSGSRVGLLSIIFGCALVLFCRKKQLSKQKPILALILASMLAASFLAQGGLERTLDKSARITEGDYSAARMSIYTIALELAQQKPISGHGIGNFLKVWNFQSSNFLERNPDAVLPEYVNHPHNEILFWLIEGGFPAVFGLLLLATGIVLAILKCGLQRGGAYAALLVPITLHTQVEMPFYISAVHWFLWLFLVFNVLKHNQKRVQINISNSGKKLLSTTAILSAMGVTYFMIHCDRAQSDIFNYLYNINVRPPYLQAAYSNIYFKPQADKVAMRSLLDASLKKGDIVKVNEYLIWAEERIDKLPEPELFTDMTTIQTYLGNSEKVCNLINLGLEMYSRNKNLMKASAQCSNEKEKWNI